MAAPNLTAERLRHFLTYDAMTGEFTRRITYGYRGRYQAGTVVGGINRDGYTRIGVSGTRYLAHRLAWLYVNGEWPPAEIDHINCVKTDNRFVNLRLATRAQNQQNLRQARRDNRSSGMLGVYATRRKWRACIQVGGKSYYLGSYRSADEAKTAYLSAKSLLHPYSNTDPVAVPPK